MVSIKNYENNKAAKVGDICTCPSCGTVFRKKSYQQVFCKSKKGTKCKDKYWNTVDPSKRNNTTRISPASRAWMERQEEYRDSHYDYDDDPGWDAHKGSF
jgi:uncharacterized C2H2 Zn-finger protein